VFEIKCNVDIPDSFYGSTSKLIAQLLGKPESYVMVLAVRTAGGMMGGAAGPCGFVKLSSIGAVGKDVNKGHAQAITEHIHSTLAIEPKRLFVCFEDLPAHTVALNGNTFA